MSIPSLNTWRASRQLLTRQPDLYHVIAENAPDAVKTGDIKSHFGRKVAIVCPSPFLMMLEADANGAAYLQDA